MKLNNLLLTVALLFPLACHAEPFWGAKVSSPVETAPDKLKPGEFVWDGQLEPSGPIVVVVSLPEQRAYVYRNGVEIGVSTASTGKKGHRTPTGVFTILQKDKHHRSSTYNSAPMPYQERLTWDGVALYAGGLPGYPSSHGCVHLPTEFARQLFDITHTGMTVVVANETTALREIGRSRLTVKNPSQPPGTHAFMAKENRGEEGNPSRLRWTTLGLPGHAAESGGKHDHDAIDRVILPSDFVRAFHALLGPGVTMLITDSPVLGQTTGVPLDVITAKPQQAS